MANIDQYLQAIMQAIYGRDVRQSIHDAIAAINTQEEGHTTEIQGYIQDAEAWAKGTKNGTAVAADDPTYHNNSKYYSEQASSSATTSSNKAGDAAASAISADTSAETSEAWAKGTKDGSPIGSSDPAYDNNAKYYAGQAQSKANEAASTLATMQSLIGDTTFSVNFSTGNLEYTSPSYTFNINTTTGNLEWEVAS